MDHGTETLNQFLNYTSTNFIPPSNLTIQFHTKQLTSLTQPSTSMRITNLDRTYTSNLLTACYYYTMTHSIHPPPKRASSTAKHSDTDVSSQTTKHYNNLSIILINRGYKNKTITEAIQHSQSELLYKDKILNNPTYSILTIPYNNNTTHIGQILRKYWHIIEQDPTLSIFWPEAPIVTYQRNKNLKDSLVCAKLQSNTITHDTTQ